MKLPFSGPRSWLPELLCLEDRLTPTTGPTSLLHPNLLLSPNQFPTPTSLFLTPDQIRHGYGIDAIPAFGGTITADGAGQTIAVVDYCDDPNIASDLAAFDAFFDTPSNKLNARPVSSFFTKVGQTGGAPLTGAGQQNGGWIGEICLDVEWAHVIAPLANILLVECDFTDPNGLYKGVSWAAARPGVSVVSNSWGGSEYATETTEDLNTFVTPAGHPGVTFVVSSGDSGVIEYPSASPNVLSVGGTNLTLGAGNRYVTETGWTYNTPRPAEGGGGGLSQFESVPGYQAAVRGVSSVVGSARGTPDVAYNGGPDSAVWIYDSFNNTASTPWDGAFGTSAGAPQWAGLVALINQGRAAAGLGPLNGLTQTNKDLYSLPAADFHDIRTGVNGYGQAAGPGYDLLTGLGTPVANRLVPDMVGISSTSLTASTSFLPRGGAVTLTATVTGPSVTATGTVAFKVGSLDLDRSTLSGGTATLITFALPVGTDVITAYYSGDATYTTSSGTATVLVGKATVTPTVAAQGTTNTYGQAVTLVATVPGLPGVTPTGTVDFTFNGTDLGPATLAAGTATLTSTFAFPAGVNTINVSYSGDSSYNPAGGSGSLTVAPAALTVTPDPQTMVYGGPVPALTYTPSGFVNGDTSSLLFGTLATTATPASGVGSYPVTQGTLSAGPNYTISVAPVALTVRPATLTLTAATLTTVYGAPVPDLTGAYAARGFVNGESTALLQGAPATDAGPTPAAGSYHITQGTLTAGPNYSIQFTDAVLTVSPAPLAVTADPKTVRYGDPLPALTYSFSGFVYADTSALLTGALATAAVTGSVVGSYNITQGTVAAGPNYAIKYLPAALTVTPAPLTVSADDLTAPNDGPIPALTYTVTGLVNGDTRSVVSGVTLSTPATGSSPPGGYPITVTGSFAANYAITTRTGTLTLTPSALLVGAPQFVVGTNASGTGAATVYNPDGSVATTITPFPEFTGPVRSAVADFNGDGTPDLIFGTGPGATAEVKIYDGITHRVVFDVNPFGTFSGGVYVAAGDIKGDGTAELVVTPDVGGGPRVIVYHTGSINPVANFFGIADPDFRGGARVAVGDLNHDGHADLAVAAGFGGGSRVSVFDGAALAQGRFVHPVGDFFAFSDALRNGTYVAIGDVNGDGFADLVIGAGPGGAPRVIVVDGRTLLSTGAAAVANPLANFYAGDTSNRDGVPVAAKNLSGNGRADIVVGGGGSTVTAYSGSSVAAGNPTAINAFDSLPGYAGGVFVG